MGSAVSFAARLDYLACDRFDLLRDLAQKCAALCDPLYGCRS